MIVRQNKYVVPSEFMFSNEIDSSLQCSSRKYAAVDIRVFQLNERFVCNGTKTSTTNISGKFEAIFDWENTLSEQQKGHFAGRYARNNTGVSIVQTFLLVKHLSH